MGRPIQDRPFRFAALGDRASLWGMAAGLALMLQPWWDGGLRAGFFVTLAATIGQTLFGRLRPGAAP